MRQSLYLLSLLLLDASALAGQAALLGRVREDSSGRLLPGVEVLLEGSRASARSDKGGEFALSGVPAGRQVVLFRAVGFRPLRLTVDVGEEPLVRLDATLVPLAFRLDSVSVTAEVSGPRGSGREAFDERRRLGFGKFIDSVELRRSEHRRLSDVLRNHNGISISQNRYAMSTRTGCYMQVIYDEQSVWSPTLYLPATQAPQAGTAERNTRSRPARPVQQAPFDINTFTVSDIESIELYRSLSDTPLQFGGPAGGCGTLVLWSRRGGRPPQGAPPSSSLP